MFLKAHTILFMLFICVAQAGAANCSGRESQSAVVENVQGLLERKAFRELDAAADTYRNHQRFSESGNLTLNAFYDTAGRPLMTGCGDVSKHEGDWKARELLLRAWVKQVPTSISGQIALAEFTVQYAYFGRSNAYWGALTGAQKNVFAERIVKARVMLAKMGPATRSDPWWYRSTLAVGVAQGWPEAEFAPILREGTEKFPFAYRIYQLGVDYYGPRWSGSDKALNDYIEATAARTALTMGETLYTKLHVHARGQFNVPPQVDWSRVREGHLRILKDFPSDYNRNGFAENACIYGDVIELKTQISILGDKLDPNAWKVPTNVQRCKALSDQFKG